MAGTLPLSARPPHATLHSGRLQRDQLVALKTSSGPTMLNQGLAKSHKPQFAKIKDRMGLNAARPPRSAAHDWRAGPPTYPHIKR